MKIKKSLILLLSIGCVLAVSACSNRTGYVPKGEFYVKLSPSNGDAGVTHVIDLEAEYKTYQGEGDIVVSVTIRN